MQKGTTIVSAPAGNTRSEEQEACFVDTDESDKDECRNEHLRDDGHPENLLEEKITILNDEICHNKGEEKEKLQRLGGVQNSGPDNNSINTSPNKIREWGLVRNLNAAYHESFSAPDADAETNTSEECKGLCSPDGGEEEDSSHAALVTTKSSTSHKDESTSMMLPYDDDLSGHGDCSAGGEKLSLVETSSPSSSPAPKSSGSADMQEKTQIPKLSLFLKFGQNVNANSPNDENKSSLLESPEFENYGGNDPSNSSLPTNNVNALTNQQYGVSGGSDSSDSESESGVNDSDNEPINSTSDNMTTNAPQEEQTSHKFSPSLSQDTATKSSNIGELKGFGSGGGQNTEPNPNSFFRAIRAFQTRRLRARGEIDERTLTAEDIEILKVDVEKNSKAGSMRAMNINITENPDEPSGGNKFVMMDWKEKLRNITSAAFAPAEYVDKLADPEDEDKGMGFYSNVPIIDYTETDERQEAFKKKEMRTMRVRNEGEVPTLAEDIVEMLEEEANADDLVSDIYFHDFYDEEPGGFYSTVKMDDSVDGNDSDDFSRIVNQNKKLIEKVKILEEELTIYKEENEIWKSKATKLEEDLFQLVTTMHNTNSLADDISSHAEAEGTEEQLVDLGDEDDSGDGDKQKATK